MNIVIRYEADERHAYAVRFNGEVYIGTCVEYPDVSVESHDEHEAMTGIIILARVLDEERESAAASLTC